MFSSMIGSNDSSRAASSRLEHQKIIIVRFLAIVEDNLGCRMHMEEISSHVGVPSRSLRYACQKCLGLSPTEYVLRRRMDMARRALQQGNCTVSNVARRFGLWELGRFAASYRKLCGEQPSMTLKLASGAVSGAVSASQSDIPTKEQALLNDLAGIATSRSSGSTRRELATFVLGPKRDIWNERNP
jgi:AraC-like DNA-binding protein